MADKVEVEVKPNEELEKEKEEPVKTQEQISSNSTKNGNNADENEEEKSVSENTSEDLASLKQRVVHQLEFYFGDYNLQRDAFLKAEMAKNDGWVPVNIFEKFHRMARLTTDPTVIVNAIKDVNSSLIEVSDDGKDIRRKPDIPITDKDDWIVSSRSRTVFVGGFPKGDQHNLDAILDFFGTICSYEAVVPRYTFGSNKVFKGSVLVIFPTIEEAKKFVNDDSVTFADVKLFKEHQEDHFLKKKRKIQEVKQEKLEKKQKEISTYSPLPKGALIKITEIPEECLRGDFVNYLIQSGLQNYSYIDYTDNKTEAYIRLKDENSAAEMLRKMIGSDDGKLKFKDQTLESVVLTGEEEEQKLQSMLEDKYRHSKMILNDRRKKKPRKGIRDFARR